MQPPRGIGQATPIGRFAYGPDKAGVAQWFDPENMRILLKSGHQIEVLDGSPRSHYLGMGESGGKFGDLVAILIHVATGTLSGAMINVADQHTLQSVSFGSLQYRPDERCFVVTSPDAAQLPQPFHYIPAAAVSARYQDLEY